MAQTIDGREADSSTPDFNPEAGRPPRQAIAPWWHTTLLIVVIVGLSIAGAWRLNHISGRPLHLIPNYLMTILYEWVLLAYTLWGFRMRGTSAREILGEWRPSWRGWLGDIGAAMLFWLAALLTLSVLSQIIRAVFGSIMDPRKISDITQKLAPTNGVEMMLFLILCISAGICEEFVFRGYLQTQLARASGLVWIGVVAAALVFGCAHGYEGIAGVLLIAAYGAMFGALVLLRRGLRTGMIAHAWHDAMSGVALVLLRHYGLHMGAK
jgi:hypothetical protein